MAQRAEDSTASASPSGRDSSRRKRRSSRASASRSRRARSSATSGRTGPARRRPSSASSASSSRTRGPSRSSGSPTSRPKARERLGFLPENPYFYDYLTAREFLAFYADLFLLGKADKEERIASLLKLVGLEKAAGLQLRKFSRGMLQRVGLAQALINDPSLVILDEPLGGLDPLGRKEIRDIIVRFKQRGQDRLPLLAHPPGHRDDLRPRGRHRRRPDRQPGLAPRPHLGDASSSPR